MRIAIVVLLGLSAACSRSFSPAPTAPAAVTGLSLNQGAALSADSPVAADAGMVLSGSGLSAVRGIQLGGVSAPIDSQSDAQIAFRVPDLADPSQQGQPQSVVVNLGSEQLTAGELRVFIAPHISGVAAGPGASGVVAGGQAYVNGSGFSSRLDENVVSVGSTGVMATVLVAEPDQLLVSLPSTTPPGPQTFTVQMVPDGTAPAAGGGPGLFAALTSSFSWVVWQPIGAFALVPPQALAGDAVRLVAPSSTLYAAYDDPPLVSSLGATAVEGGTTGGVAPTGTASGGTGSGSVSGAATSSSSGSNNSAPVNDDTVGGTFAGDAGAANVSDPYPSSDPSPQLASTFDRPSVALGHANAAMHVTLDAIDTGVVPWQRSDGALLVNVPTTAPGGHTLAIGDPSGPSPSTSLPVLRGHVEGPSMNCRAPDPFTPGGGLVTRALRSDQSAGEVIAWDNAAAGGTTLTYAPINSGGSLGTEWSLPFDDAVTLVGAGRGTLFVGVGGGYLHAAPIGAPVSEVVVGVPGVPLAALEPDFETALAWTLVTRPSQSPLVVPWGADPGEPIGYDLGALNSDSSCTVVSAALEKVHRVALGSSSLERATVTYSCSTGLEVAVSQLFDATPPDGGLAAASGDTIVSGDGGTLTSPVVTLAAFDTLGVAPLVVTAQGLALAYGNGALAIDANAGATGLPESEALGDGGPFAADLSITAAALAPDAQQAAVAGLRTAINEPVVRLYDRQFPADGSTPSWLLQGEFVLPAGQQPTAVAYDAAGGQVVVLLQEVAAVPAESGYCSLQ